MRRASAGVAGAWVLGLGLAAVVLTWAGQGDLAGPPLTDPGRWAVWLDGRSPVVAGFALLRLCAMGALWYVAASAAIGAALRAVGAVSLVRVADRVTIGPIPRMLAGTMSVGLAASGLIAVAAPALRLPAAAAQQTVPPPTTIPSTSIPSTSIPSTSIPSTSIPLTSAPSTSLPPPTTAPAPPAPTVFPPATVTMHRLTQAEVSAPSAPAPATAPARSSTPGAAPADRWTVRPGECFWSIAERVLTDRSGQAPTDAEIVPYWRRLIDANRHELAQRDNPDLIFPGQVFVVPAP